MRDRLAISAEVWGLRLRNVVTLGVQIAGFGAILFGATVLFLPALAGFGVPTGGLPAGEMSRIYEQIGLHWLVWMVGGALVVWLTTRG